MEEIIIPIIKEIDEITLAGKPCTKISIKKIVTDTTPKDNVIVDAIETVEVEGKMEDKIYYTDIAIPMANITFSLSEAEIEALKK